jgi:hypothetical protein
MMGGGTVLVAFGRTMGPAVSATQSLTSVVSGVVSVGDVDADGFDDILGGAGSSLYLLHGSPTGLVTTGLTPLPAFGSYSVLVPVGDINGDGVCDVGYTVSVVLGSNVRFLLGSHTGFTPAPASPSPIVGHFLF